MSKEVMSKEALNTEKQVKPALWNPNVAAIWSLLFTPILGAWLHAENWKELNEPEKAAKSMWWVYGGFVFMLVMLFLPDNVGKFPSVVFLLLWYFTSAKKQADYVQEKQIEYEKKGWQKPLLISLVGLVFLFSVYVMTDNSYSTEVETTAKHILNEQILPQLSRDNGNKHQKCVEVNLGDEFADNNYYATAIFNDGSKAELTIQIKGQEVIVQVR